MSATGRFFNAAGFSSLILDSLLSITGVAGNTLTDFAGFFATGGGFFDLADALANGLAEIADIFRFRIALLGIDKILLQTPLVYLNSLPNSSNNPCENWDLMRGTMIWIIVLTAARIAWKPVV
jgi:hypothetical protein